LRTVSERRILAWLIAQRALELLVQHVERGMTLPPSQCIARGGAIANAPAQPEHCADLFVP